jgi:hypothetical protein
MLIVGNVSVIASTPEKKSIYSQSGEQRICIIGTIDIINRNANLILFHGNIGFYFSIGLIGVSIGGIRNNSFTIYEDLFNGLIKEHFIMGFGIQKTGPY